MFDTTPCKATLIQHVYAHVNYSPPSPMPPATATTVNTVCTAPSCTATPTARTAMSPCCHSAAWGSAYSTQAASGVCSPASQRVTWNTCHLGGCLAARQRLPTPACSKVAEAQGFSQLQQKKCGAASLSQASVQAQTGPVWPPASAPPLSPPKPASECWQYDAGGRRRTADLQRSDRCRTGL